MPRSKNFRQAAKISAKQQKFSPSSKNFHQAAKIFTKPENFHQKISAAAMIFTAAAKVQKNCLQRQLPGCWGSLHGFPCEIPVEQINVCQPLPITVTIHITKNQ
jgi:hypothetical protein